MGQLLDEADISPRWPREDPNVWSLDKPHDQPSALSGSRTGHQHLTTATDLFDKFDTNKDGVISRAEFNEYLKYLPASTRGRAVVANRIRAAPAKYIGT